jgi:Tol biopolymer transport system component
MIRALFVLFFALCTAPLAGPSAAQELPRVDPSIRAPRLLTQNPGDVSPWDNAEAYFSNDGQHLIFQATRDGRKCDAIYEMDLQGQGIHMISSGDGRCTCAYYSPDGKWIVYASTHADSPDCPPRPDMSAGYTWPVYGSYEIYIVPAEGGAPVALTNSPGYDAEAVFRPDGRKILFTSMRDGDLELYDMNPDGSEVRRLTHSPGYDGGAFYTADSRRIVFRARHPEGEELEDFQALLAQGLVRPGQLDLFVMDADGQNLQRITSSGDLGATNWAPFPHPDGRRVIFASNRDDFDGTVPGEYGYNFELYLIGMDGEGIRRLTFNRSFDGFPMFSADGRHLVWCGNYVPSRPRDTDVLLADWVE